MNRDGTFDISGAKWGLPDTTFRGQLRDGQVDETEIFGLSDKMPGWLACAFQDSWALNACTEVDGVDIEGQERADADCRLTHAAREGD